jgi:hypothetical protein
MKCAGKQASTVDHFTTCKSAIVPTIREMPSCTNRRPKAQGVRAKISCEKLSSWNPTFWTSLFISRRSDNFLKGVVYEEIAVLATLCLLLDVDPSYAENGQIFSAFPQPRGT